MAKRQLTPEQRARKSEQQREWYAKHRERVLAQLRQRSPDERARLNAHKRERYQTNPVVREQAKAWSAAWRADPANHGAIATYNARYYASEGGRAVKRADRLMRYFHLTVAQYDAMLAEQGGVCAICRQPETHQHRGRGIVVSLAVDHDHRCCPGKTSCGECVRGLLCDRCNVGRFPDEPVLLRAAADYFEHYRR